MYKEANPKLVLVAGLKGLIAAQLTVLPAAAAAADAVPAAATAAAAPAREARFRKKTMTSSLQGSGDVEAHSP
jgi:hypothetical protein